MCQYSKPGPFQVQVKAKAGAATFLLGTYTVQPTQVMYRNLPFGIFQLFTAAHFNNVAISSPSFEAWAAPFIDAGTALEFQVDIDTANQVFETNIANNNLAIAGRSLLPLSGSFFFGPVQASLQTSSIPLIATGGSCGSNSGNGTLSNVKVNAAANWTPATDGLWNPMNFNLTNYCAGYRRNGNVFDLFNVGTNFSNAGSVSGQLGGFDVTVPTTQLKSDGAHPSATMTVTLPENLSYHLDDGTARPMPQGDGFINVTLPNTVNNDYSTLAGSLTGGFLHSEMLPFSFGVNLLAIDSTGINGNYAKVVYVYDRIFDAQDQRRLDRNGVVSNDIRFFSPQLPPSPVFSIDPSAGLRVPEVDFQAFAGIGKFRHQTHFPAAKITWNAFSVAVLAGKLVDQQLLAGGSSYHFKMNTDCAGCDSNSAVSPDYILSQLSARGGLGWDGSVATPVHGIVDPYWGPWDSTNSVNIFKRSGDAATFGILYLPGFVAQGTGTASGISVPEYLLGMRKVVQNAGNLLPSVFYALKTTTSRRGNYFMAGVNVGPELYSNPINKKPVIGLGSSLADTTTTIGFGGLMAPDYKNVTSNVGTKYVVRHGGLTGVFNASAAPQPVVYGYALQLDRFAFRQVSNVLDDYSWIDGKVSVPGKGGFQIYFESLALECSGNFNKGTVPRESVCADGINNNNNLWVDENCGQSLLAWNANIDLQSMAFVSNPPGAGACVAQNRELQVGNDVELKALQKRLGMLANWSPAGEPSNASVSGSTEHVLDQPASPSATKEAVGFDVALNSGIALKTPTGTSTHGWFAMDADVALPFWETLKTSARVANINNATADKTIIINRGGNLTGSDDAQTNAVLAGQLKASTPNSFTADYRWGETGFGFGLPIYYDAARPGAGTRPGFLGRTWNKDLWVMQLNAGTDFVTPTDTKISFGASADFEKLANAQISLNIDLSDPDSVAKIDSFLGGVGVSGAPVGTLVNGVKTAANRLNAVADAKLDEFLKDQLHKALDLINPDPFKAAADAMGVVQSIPEQLASSISNGLSNLTDQLINPLSSSLDQKMMDAYNNVPSLLLQAQIDPTPVQTQLDQYISIMDQADSMVSQVSNVLNQVDSEVGSVVSQVNGLVSSVNTTTTGAVDQAISAIDAVTGTITDVTQFAARVCGPNSDVRARVDQFKGMVQDAKNTLKLFDLAPFASSVGSVAGIDMSGVNAAQTTIQNLVNDVEGRINQATAGLDVALNNCGTLVGQINDAAMLDAALAFIGQVRNALNQVKGAMTTLQTTLLDPVSGLMTKISTKLAIANQQVAAVREYIGTLKSMLEQAKNQFPDGFEYAVLTQAQIQAQMDQVVSVLTGGVYHWSYGSHSFVQQMANDLRQPIDAAIADAAAAASAQLTPLVSLFPHPTSEEMKTMIVDYVMNSQAVDAVVTEVNKFFSEIVDELNKIVLTGFDQVNNVIKDVVKKLEDKANAALKAATAPIKSLPVMGGELDGYALMVGDELARLHVNAEWTMKGDSDDSSTSYNAALDITSWSANSKGANCGAANPSSLLDAQISTTDLPITVAGSETLIKKLYLGFTLDGTIPAPVGIFGGISINGTIDFEAFKVFDPAFAAGVGVIENYVGASAGASFDSLQLELAFLVGKTCNSEVLASLDPVAAEFITLPGGVFNGGYARGSASIPIWDAGCLLTVGVGAEVGAWVLVGPPLTIGGIVGGSAYGKAVCIAALRGQVTAYGEKSGDQFSFKGDGFGVGGLGFCEPSTWTTISRSRKDSWCGTGDASFAATYKNGWHLNGPSTSAIH